MTSCSNIRNFGVIYRTLISAQIDTKSLEEISATDVNKVMQSLRESLVCSDISVFVVIRNYRIEELGVELEALLNKFACAVLQLNPEYKFVDTAYALLRRINSDLLTIPELLRGANAPKLYVKGLDAEQSSMSRGLATVMRLGRKFSSASHHDTRKTIALQILALIEFRAQAELYELLATGLLSGVEEWDKVFLPLEEASKLLGELSNNLQLGNASVARDRTKQSVDLASKKLNSIAVDRQKFLRLMLQFHFNFRIVDIKATLLDMRKRRRLLLEDVLRLINAVRKLPDDRVQTRASLDHVECLYQVTGPVENVAF